MNNKGFTLIELLAVLLLLGIVAVFSFTTVGNYLESSKNSAYKTLVSNIKTAAIEYYEECKFNKEGITDPNKCKISSKKLEFNISELLELGYLSGDCSDDSCTVLNPKTNSDIGACSITITENKITIDATESNPYKTTYSITASSGTDCPTTSDYLGV